MPPDRPLRICIDARLFSGRSGGIEQVAIGLIDALSNLTDGDEQYLVLTYPLSQDWIKPYVKGPCQLLVATGVHPPPPWKRALKRLPAASALGQRLTGWPARRSI